MYVVVLWKTVQIWYLKSYAKMPISILKIALILTIYIPIVKKGVVVNDAYKFS